MEKRKEENKKNKDGEKLEAIKRANNPREHTKGKIKTILMDKGGKNGAGKKITTKPSNFPPKEKTSQEK